MAWRPQGAVNRQHSAPSTWNTPHRLYEEKRAASSSSTLSSPLASTSTSVEPSSADLVQVRGIAIAGWRIETHRGSIADSKTIDELSDAWGIPLPEMPFDKNQLVIRYEGAESSKDPLSDSSTTARPGTWDYCFDGIRALRTIDGVNETQALEGINLKVQASSSSATNGMRHRHSKPSSAFVGQKPSKSKRVQVSYAHEWGKKRDQATISPSQPSSRGGELSEHTSSQRADPTSHFGAETAAAVASGSITTARDYDWTYSCTWPGSEGEVSPSETQQSDAAGSASKFTPATDPARDRIPVERLGPPPTPGATAEPILFFDDLILFEDELGDNGTSMLGVKIRVMPTGFLVLQRFFLRVDNVIFRLFDTRMYVGFYDHDNGDTGSTFQGATQQMASLALDGATGQQPFQQSVQLSKAPRVIRECSGCQEKYADVRARLPPYKSHDLSPLTDPGWVAQQLTKMAEDRERNRHQTMAARSSSNNSSHLTHPGTMVPMDQSDPTQPAVLPSTAMPGTETNRILGEIDQSDSEDQWEGEGHRIDVAVLL